jgi:peptide/nickel transport system permease protein
MTDQPARSGQLIPALLPAREEMSKPARRPLPKKLLVGLAIFLTMALAVYLGPFLLSYDPNTQDLPHRLQSPDAAHLLGTDNFGRDILTRVLYAGRIDLQIGVIATLLSFFPGLVVGAVAGYYGRWVDTLVMRLADVLIAFPHMVLVIAIVAMLGTGVRNMYIAIVVSSWIVYARLVRGEMLAAKNFEYTQAARIVGCRNWRIIWRHIGPNVITPAIVFALSDVVLNILFAASLGFLGLGVQAPTPEWGTMVADGRSFLGRAPGMALYPGLAIVLTGVAFSFIGDGLTDYMRPGG